MLGTLRRARSLIGLSWSERRLLVWAALQLVAIDLGLRLLGFDVLLRRISRGRGVEAREVHPTDLSAARERACWLEMASRHSLVRARCLHRALALHRWARRRGLPSELRIGVRRDGDGLAAHAWVELSGEPLDDPTLLGAFTPLKGGLGRSPAVLRGDRLAGSPGGVAWRLWR